MKRMFPILLSFLTFTASAQTAVTVSGEERMSEAADLQTADAMNDARNQPLCLQETGTRIRHRAPVVVPGAPQPRAVDCAQPGRSYSRRDIDRTGAVNIADALRMLDPSIH